MPASRHRATSRSMRVARAAPVGGDDGRRAGGAERRERLTREIFSAETVLSSPCRSPKYQAGRDPQVRRRRVTRSVRKATLLEALTAREKIRRAGWVLRDQSHKDAE